MLVLIHSHTSNISSVRIKLCRCTKCSTLVTQFQCLKFPTERVKYLQSFPFMGILFVVLRYCISNQIKCLPGLSKTAIWADDFLSNHIQVTFIDILFFMTSERVHPDWPDKLSRLKFRFRPYRNSD